MDLRRLSISIFSNSDTAENFHEPSILRINTVPAGFRLKLGTSVDVIKSNVIN